VVGKEKCSAAMEIRVRRWVLAETTEGRGAAVGSVVSVDFMIDHHLPPDPRPTAVTVGIPPSAASWLCIKWCDSVTVG